VKKNVVTKKVLSLTLALVIAFALVSVLSGCGGGATEEQQPPPVEQAQSAPPMEQDQSAPPMEHEQPVAPAEPAPPAQTASALVGLWEVTEFVFMDIGYGDNWYDTFLLYLDDGTGIVTYVWAEDSSWQRQFPFTWSTELGVLAFMIDGDIMPQTASYSVVNDILSISYHLTGETYTYMRR